MRILTIVFMSLVMLANAQTGTKTMNLPTATDLTSAYIIIDQLNVTKKAPASLFTVFGPQTANYFYAAPNGSSGLPSFRAMVANDVPTLNQNTTGSAGSVLNALTVDNSSLQLDAGTTYNGNAARTISVKVAGITNAMLAGSIDLTSKVTGVLPIANGGTGSSTKIWWGLTGTSTLTGATSIISGGPTANTLDFNITNDGFLDLGAIRFNVNGSGAVGFTDSAPVLKYLADRSSQFTTPRTITDKGYQDGHLNGLTFTNSPNSTNVPVYNGTNWTFQNVGTVTSVGITDGNNITHSGGPITSSGNITLNVVPAGGTGQIQYNDGASPNKLAASANLFFTSGNLSLKSGNFTTDDGGSNAIAIGPTGMFVGESGNIYTFQGATLQLDSHAGYAGLNLGTVAGDPATTNNSDIWYNSTTGKFRGKQNGSLVDLISAAASPGGSSGQLQYNNSGVFDGASNLTVDPTNHSFQLSDPSGTANGILTVRARSSSTGGDPEYFFTSNPPTSALSFGDNVAIGDLALQSRTTGAAGNTVVGMNSGNGITTGSDNTFIGFAVAPTITTGSHNIGLGDNLDFSSSPFSNTGSSQVQIGDLLKRDASGEVYLTITRTSCSGAPSGSLAVVAGVLTKCP